MKILRRIFLILILFLVLITALALGYYYVITKDFSLQPQKLVLNEKSVVMYDGVGQEVKNTSLYFTLIDANGGRLINHNNDILFLSTPVNDTLLLVESTSRGNKVSQAIVLDGKLNTIKT